MRCVSLVAVVVGLGVANVSAQDPFTDVTNAPRPSEFIHWDAESFAGFKRELVDQLRAGPGIEQIAHHLGVLPFVPVQLVGVAETRRSDAACQRPNQFDCTRQQPFGPVSEPAHELLWREIDIRNRNSV